MSEKEYIDNQSNLLNDHMSELRTTILLKWKEDTYMKMEKEKWNSLQ